MYQIFDLATPNGFCYLSDSLIFNLFIYIYLNLMTASFIDPSLDPILKLAMNSYEIQVYPLESALKFVST